MKQRFSFLSRYANLFLLNITATYILNKFECSPLYIVLVLLELIQSRHFWLSMSKHSLSINLELINLNFDTISSQWACVWVYPHSHNFSSLFLHNFQVSSCISYIIKGRESSLLGVIIFLARLFLYKTHGAINY